MPVSAPAQNKTASALDNFPRVMTDPPYIRLFDERHCRIELARQQCGQFDRVRIDIEPYGTGEDHSQDCGDCCGSPDEPIEPQRYCRWPVPCGFQSDIPHHTEGPVGVERRLLAQSMGFRQCVLYFLQLFIVESCHRPAVSFRVVMHGASVALDAPAP